MVVVKDVDWKMTPGAGCNNGIYNDVTVTFSDGKSVYLTACRCGKGCHSTDTVPKVGDKFKDMSDFWDYCNPYY